tara:strand:+ start:227 stop:436 length:210 start_codon:yes stop_codon:yes gene_type:complete
MKIKVNGREELIHLENEELFLLRIIVFLGYDPQTVVVELNNLIINSKKWDSKKLKDGDKLEIVSIVGGG